MPVKVNLHVFYNFEAVPFENREFSVLKTCAIGIGMYKVIILTISLFKLQEFSKFWNFETKGYLGNNDFFPKFII